MSELPRLSTGVAALDRMLGGGLLPGRLTVVVGATGIGKTQLGIQFADAGRRQEGEPGILFDMTTRGDSQGHREYANRLCNWQLTERSSEADVPVASVWENGQARSDYLHLFDRSGRRVTIGDLQPDDWREWKIELARKLNRAVAFFYGNFVHGVRRCVVDGVEPTDKASDSFQMHVFDYVYHQILRKEADWVARDLLREQFRTHADQVAAHGYNHRDIGCLLLYTSHEVLLDELLARPIESGDVLSNANTVILMGKIRNGDRMGRGLSIAKHRGSACDDRIASFEIGERGILLSAQQPG